MRDLQKDLEEWITDHDIGKRGEWFYMTGEYIERAINAEAENTKLKKALWWAVGQINDEELPDKHICGYHVRPDTGYCEWCENYGKAFELSGWEKDEEGE